jgi:DNA-binding CsgD family transcriptional regulator/PAS domain-containing protein
VCGSFNAHGAWLIGDAADESSPRIDAFWNLPPRKIKEQLAGLSTARDAATANAREKSNGVIRKHVFLLDEQRDSRPLDVAIFKGESGEASFGVAFAAGQSDLNEKLLGSLEQIYQHLQRAIGIRNAADRRAKQYEDMLDALSIPLFLLQSDREILFSNRAAREMLTGQSALVVMANRLASPEPHLHSLMQGKVDAIAASHAGRPTATAIALGEKANNAILHLTSGRTNFNGGPALNGRTVLAAVRPAIAVDARDMHVIREVFGLSDVESEITGLVMQNMPPRAIGSVRQTSEQTVRWHLKNIYSKTATRGFRGLILKMLSACSPFR